MNWYKEYKTAESKKAIDYLKGLGVGMTAGIITLAGIFGYGQITQQEADALSQANQNDPTLIVQHMEMKRPLPLSSPIEPTPPQQEVNVEQVSEPQSSGRVSLADMHAMVKRYEGIMPKMYIERNGKEAVKTVGVGLNVERSDAATILKAAGVKDIEGVMSGRTAMTPEQIDAALDIQLTEAIEIAEGYLSNLYEHPLGVQQIIVDMAFNLGATKFSKFVELRKALLRKDYNKAAAEMIDSEWFGQVGRRSKEHVAKMRSFAL